MNTDQVMALEDKFQIPTYSKMPLALVHGEGATVTDADGKSYLDYYGGHCVTLLGHRHPAVVAAIKAQADELLFYSNAVYSPVRAAATEKLANLAPEGLQNVFFCNSGTEANETALKLARSFTGRNDVIAMVGDFHGRTLGSLATTWNPAYREPYAYALPRTYFVDFSDLKALDTALRNHPDVAAVIVEPIQSMAGVVTADAVYFQGVRSLCDTHGVVLIFDEVQTGVGRTGSFSISTGFSIKPDIITLAKSLGSGVPVGAVLIDDAIASEVRPGDQGTTFGGGMIAMAAVEATLTTLVDEELMARAPVIFDRIKAGLSVPVTGAGCLIGVKLPCAARPILTLLREFGILAGGSADPNVIRLMPPIVTTDDEIDRFSTTFESILADVLEPV